MALGEYDDDEMGFAPPPARADRTWRHPAEMAAEARATKRRASRRLWGVGLGGALGGALAMASVWYLTDPGGDVQVVTQRVAVAPVESVAPRVTPADQWATEVAAGAMPATAIIQSADGTHTIAGAIAVHDDGYLLTSRRALDDVRELTVHTHDGEIFTAVVLGYDLETDLSVLKADGTVSTVPVASTPAGDGDVVATVDPGGRATRAVVTDLAASATAVDGDLLVGFTSLDSPRADLPPGSPVVDATGSVVGITAAVEADAPVTIVPIDVANAVAESIIVDGRVWHAWLGVTVEAGDGEGVTVTATSKDGPADRAGVEVDDRIVSVDDVGIDSAAELVSRLRHHRPDDTVVIVVDRDGERVTLDATLEIDPADFDD